MSDMGWLIVTPSIIIQPFNETPFLFFAEGSAEVTERQWQHGIDVKLVLRVFKA